MPVYKMKPTLNGEGGQGGGADLGGMYPNTILDDLVNKTIPDASSEITHTYIPLAKLKELIDEKFDLVEFPYDGGSIIYVMLNSGYMDFGSNPGFHISNDHIKLYLNPAEIEGDYFLTAEVTTANDQGETITVWSDTLATVKISDFNNWNELLNYVIANVEDTKIIVGAVGDGAFGDFNSTATASIQPFLTQLLLSDADFTTGSTGIAGINVKLDLEKFIGAIEDYIDTTTTSQEI